MRINRKKVKDKSIFIRKIIIASTIIIVILLTVVINSIFPNYQIYRWITLVLEFLRDISWQLLIIAFFLIFKEQIISIIENGFNFELGNLKLEVRSLNDSIENLTADVEEITEGIEIEDIDLEMSTIFNNQSQDINQIWNDFVDELKIIREDDFRISKSKPKKKSKEQVNKYLMENNIDVKANQNLGYYVKILHPEQYSLYREAMKIKNKYNQFDFKNEKKDFLNKVEIEDYKIIITKTLVMMRENVNKANQEYEKINPIK